MHAYFLLNMLTPAMQQYYDIKANYADAIVFFRMGDFYEMFGEDAKLANKILGITLTSRNKNASTPELLAGIPYHAKDKYLPVLVNAGHKVAIVEQVSDPKLKGIVQREVVRVVTPATMHLEGEGYQAPDQNLILSLTCEGNTFGFSCLNILTHHWQTGEFSSLELLASELIKWHPQEVIIDKKLFGNTQISEIFTAKYSLNVYYFDVPAKSREYLCEHFSLPNLKGFGVDGLKNGLQASALLLSYLQNHQKNTFANLKHLSLYTSADFLRLDIATIRNLDLVYNFFTQSATTGTLFGTLNKTKTPMGKRKLYETILQPLTDIDTITFRLDLIESLKADNILLSELAEKLSHISDIDAILNRFSVGRVTPRDLVVLKDSLQAFEDIKTLLLKKKGKWEIFFSRK